MFVQRNEFNSGKRTALYKKYYYYLEIAGGGGGGGGGGDKPRFFKFRYTVTYCRFVRVGIQRVVKGFSFLFFIKVVTLCGFHQPNYFSLIFRFRNAVVKFVEAQTPRPCECSPWFKHSKSRPVWLPLGDPSANLTSGKRREMNSVRQTFLVSNTSHVPHVFSKVICTRVAERA